MSYVAVVFVTTGLYNTTVAESFDPTKPPIFQNKPRYAPPKLAKLNPQDFQVTSILVSDQRKVAVINNQVVTVGQVVTAGESAKATVTGIRATEVTLSKARQEITVHLPSSQYIKPAGSGQSKGLKDQP